MRIFMSDRMRSMMRALGMKDGESIEHSMVTNAVEKAQRKVEGRNFDIRKQLLKYDDVANDQRHVIYNQRNDLMAMEDISHIVNAIRADVISEVVNQFVPPQSTEEHWDIEGLEKELQAEFDLNIPVAAWLKGEGVEKVFEEDLAEKIIAEAQSVYDQKAELAGPEVLRQFEKQVMLQVLDNLWKEHLATMDYLRQGIHLRGYGQKNPEQEYKRESFILFEQLLHNIKHDSTRILSHVKVRSEEEIQEMEAARRAQAAAMAQQAQYEHGSMQEEQDEDVAQPFVRDERKVGRNEACPCGSGKKYKHCHGALA